MTPLKVDGGIFTDLARVPELVGELETQGYDACWTGEINHDPFLPLLLAAEHTSRLEIGTSIAVAFARSPMTVANIGWDLQTYSQGRFIMGLGTQIKPHIEKRFSMPWSRPVARMREYVLALQAIWSAWNDGTKLRFEGEFYTHKLMTPMFTPEPQVSWVAPPIFIAAVGEAMTEMCGEVADGLLAHAFTTRQYLHEVTLPAVESGLQRSGRNRSAFQVACPVFVVTGLQESELDAAAVGVRKQIAFYGSTPAYRKVLALHGWGEVADELHRLSLQGEWDAMATLVDDDILRAFAVVATVDKLAVAIKQRCDGVIDRVMPSFPRTLPADTVAAVLNELRQ
ncbi:LLM class F420-dependent oxidoreductase [Candidatus Mycobacterium wuenschmannii]|uniref:LLM class F420-dependent oxidoreductase n=1 Tax=Candidatus Mycobacterium wuenschmannii TaxID=3027808 RepID=A0ABY8W3C7_9MYCO|nr:LLM class F420-dependent oxidoreductase [Candidatus Mycobacterium wuenschmannii]WIM89586.1 LLM class F420-dependent oxidoreductase [Candidatus Mycobacterium wuenschmannii]